MIDNAVARIKEKLSSPESALVLSHLYDQQMGLINLDPKKQNVFGDTLFHKEEDPNLGTRLELRMRDYTRSNVIKHFGVSFTEFLEYNPVVCDQMVNISYKLENERAKLIDSLNDEVE